MTMKPLLLTTVLLASLLAAPAARAQGFDSSGNSLLQGNYFVRLVVFDNLATSGAVGRARALNATIAFDGSGNYNATGQLSDSTVSSGAPQTFSFKGTYGVSPSG